MPKKVNHTENLGKKFNRLTVLEVIPKGKYYYYNCSCECGGQTTAPSFSIIKGKQVSCGCYFKEEVPKKLKGHIGANRKSNGEPSFKYLLSTYKRNARNREIEFQLTYEQVKMLTKQHCYFCGIGPLRPVKYHTTKRNENYPNHYLHNGIDRLDNNKGYIVENCVACCRTCNVAKASQTFEEFLSWIERVYKYNVIY